MSWNPLKDTIGKLFETPDPDTFITDPLARNKFKASDYLTALLDKKVPKQGVAGMSDIESYGQDYLRNYVTGDMPGGVSGSYDYYRQILDQPADITQLPGYKGVVNSVGAMTDEAVNRANRRTQMSGMGASTPQGKAVGKEIALGGQRMLSQLAPYAEAERGRQFNAAQMLAEIAQLQEMLQQGRLGAIQQFGGLPRELNQAELNAMYNQLMAPYTTKAPVAQGIVGNGVEYTVQQEPSLFQQIAPLLIKAGEAAASAIAAKSGNTGKK